MKKKNGFTLVELLAVIVILAVILVIAVPKITDVIENTKKSSAARGTELYADGVKNAMLKYQLEHDGKITTDVSMLNIKMDGAIGDVFSLELDENGEVSSLRIYVNNYICNYSNKIATCKDADEYMKEFMIDGHRASYIDGMTWDQWHNSKYYSDHFTFDSTNILFESNIVTYQGVYIKPSDKMKNTGEYISLTCFTEGTKVLTRDGLVSIENIKRGDLVYTYNENTKEYSYNKVEMTHENLVIKDKTTIIINGKEIISTSKHNYYTLNRGWVEAYDLRQNDHLLNDKGKIITIDSVKTEKSNEGYYVYNLTIENNHNYFVGEDSILVHNGVTC